MEDVVTLYRIVKEFNDESRHTAATLLEKAISEEYHDVNVFYCRAQVQVQTGQVQVRKVRN